MQIVRGRQDDDDDDRYVVVSEGFGTAAARPIRAAATHWLLRMLDQEVESG